MRFERLFTEAGAFAEQIGADQPGAGGVDVHHGAAGEVQRAVGSQIATAPHHVRDRQVRQGEPQDREDQHRREANAFGEAPHHQRHGNAGEGGLESDVDHLADAAGDAVDADAFQHRRLESAEHRIAFAERQAVAIQHPQHADQREGDGDLRQHRQHVFAAQQAAVKQRDAGQRHEQHQRGADHHKGVVGLIGDRRGGQGQRRNQGYRTQAQHG